MLCVKQLFLCGWTTSSVLNATAVREQTKEVSWERDAKTWRGWVARGFSCTSKTHTSSVWWICLWWKTRVLYYLCSRALCDVSAALRFCHTFVRAIKNCIVWMCLFFFAEMSHPELLVSPPGMYSTSFWRFAHDSNNNSDTILIEVGVTVVYGSRIFLISRSVYFCK